MPSNTYDTTNPGSAVSNYEDLSSTISYVVPRKTPVTSMIPKGTCSATFPEWTVDKYKTPSTLAGGVAETADVSSFSDQYEDRSRIGNYVQTVRDTWSVSRLQQRAASAGPADVANAKAKCAVNVKLGMEYVICGTQDRQAENGAGNPYKTRGLGDWIDSSGPADVPSAYRTPSASIDTQGTSVAEADFQAIFESIFSASGEVSNVTVVAGPDQRTNISSFTRASATQYNVNEDAAKKKTTYAVDFFDTDYGMATIVNGNPDCLPAADYAYFLPMDLLELLVYDPIHMIDLEDQGAGQRGFCDWTAALCLKNPRGFAKIT